MKASKLDKTNCKLTDFVQEFVQLLCEAAFTQQVKDGTELVLSHEPTTQHLLKFEKIRRGVIFARPETKRHSLVVNALVERVEAGEPHRVLRGS